jgi:amino acid adenylation domain-containing protein
MSTPESLLEQLRQLGVTLWYESGQLRYRAPKGVLTPERIAELRSRKDEIVAVLQSQLADALPLTRRERKTPLPLSFAQERLWFVEQLDNLGASYNMPAAVRLEGKLDVTALERSFAEIVRRHESLRTRFPVIDGVPIQVVDPPGFRLEACQLTAEDSGEREREAARRRDEEALRRFDLENGPLFRVTLLRLETERHVMLVTMHHIVSDGLSVAVLIRELVTLYTAFSNGRPLPLSDLPVQYVDYAIWQREWLQGEVLERLLAYWKTRLEDVPFLELPVDRARPALMTYQGAGLETHISAETTARLKQLCRAEGATVYIGLLTIFQLLLSRYSGQRDIAVGSPVAGRPRKETENLIGFFVNTVVVRTRIAPNLRFSELLRGVRESVFEALKHQDAPFEKLVEEIAPQRQLSRPPLFQAMFVQNDPVPVLQLGDLNVRWWQGESRTSKFEITLVMEESERGLKAELEYNSDLFKAATMARLLEHFRNLVEEVAANAQIAVGRLNLLSDAERRQLLDEWNQTEVEFDTSRCVHQLFADQSRKTPAAVAVEFEGERLEYAELNRRANQLAHCLSGKLGARREERIGICVDRSLATVIGALGVLKAGCAYVPFDPEAPGERLAYAIKDAGIRILLTQESLAKRLHRHDVELVCLDTARPTLANEEPGEPALAVDPRTLAYVIYTSGSTGLPKGVTVEHRQLSNYVQGILYREKGLRGTSVAMVQPLSVDACLTSWLAPLLSGGTVHVISRERGLSANGLSEYVSAKQIEVLKMAPSHFQALHEGSGEQLMPSRLLVLGGESSRWNWVQFLLAEAPACAVLNQYGPTETTVGALTFRVDETDREREHATTPIGRPLPNTRVYVLDDQMELLPVGAPGELFIAGRGVARGYLNQPALTAQRFVPDPFSRQPGSRLYRTGDRVRYLADGNVEFLGRFDHQVKIRGYRIELEEIEIVLQHCEGVRHAAAVVRELNPGEPLLVAYVVPERHGARFEKDRLRKHVAERLPEYMAPARFVELEELPLTANGKVNRKALLDWDLGIHQSGGGDAGENPGLRNEHEEILCGIWEQLLGVEKVGPEENFFELGGHSLLATRLVSQVRKVFGVELPLRTVFSSPTVRGMAASLATEARRRGPEIAAPSPDSPMTEDGMVRRSGGGPAPLSFAQQRLWVLDQMEPGSSLYNVVASVLFEGDLNVDALEQAIGQIVERHEALRTTFDLRDPQPVQIVAPTQAHRINLVDLTNLLDEERDRRAKELFDEEANRPFDLKNGPLFRTTLYRLNQRRHVFVMAMHHIVSDAWSTALLAHEVSELYTARVSGYSSSLPDLPIQYSDFAVWQRQWLDGAVREQHLEYWKRQLSGNLPVLELPADAARPEEQAFHGAALSFAILQPLAQSFKAFCRAENVTLFMALLAVFKVLLHRYTGSEDLVVGTPIANRQRHEVENLIGFFTNTLAIRTDLSGNPVFRDLLKVVRETTLDAYAHQDMPFEYLVDQLNPERSLGRNPVVQVMFVLKNTPKPELRLPGVTATPFNNDFATAKFDLSFYLDDRGDQIEGVIEYNSDLFFRERMEQMAGHFQRLAAAVVSDPGARISDLDPLVTAPAIEAVESPALGLFL